MTESMIERVAKGIRDSNCGVGSTEPWQDYVEDAYAAIAAMREPTERMMEVAAIKVHAGQDSAEEIYYAVIDAALQWPAGSADRAGVPLAED